MSARLSGMIFAIREIVVATARDIPIDSFSDDDDFVDDLCLDEMECESLGLIIEERFGARVPDEIWLSPLYRTPESLAEWVIRHADLHANAELQRQRKRA